MALCGPSRHRFKLTAAQVLGLGTIALAAGASLFPSRQSVGSTPAFLHGSARSGALRASRPVHVSRQPTRAGWARRRGRPGQTGVGWGGGAFGRGGAKKHEGQLPHAVSVLLHDEPTSFGGRQPVTSHAARWFIRRCILSRAKASEALNVEVEARSNRDAMKGRWESVSVEFQEMIFEDIQVTGGARFELLGVDLLTLGLLPGPWRRLRRLRRPCEVTATSELTDADVAYSPAIRRLAQRLVNHALRPRGRKPDGFVSGGGGGHGEVAAGSPQAARVGADVGASGGGGAGREGWGRQGELEPRVSVLNVRVRGNKLAIEGEMSNGGPFLRVPFRYDFSLSASRDGHVLHFKGKSVYWGTPGGHVPLPMLPLQSFNVDLGDRARIEHLRISRGVLSIGGRFILTNTAGFTVAHPGFTRGNINYDLAESLSRLVSNILRLRRE